MRREPEKEQRIQNVTYLCLTVSDKVIDTINPKKKIKKKTPNLIHGNWRGGEWRKGALRLPVLIGKFLHPQGLLEFAGKSKRKFSVKNYERQFYIQVPEVFYIFSC